MKSKHFQDENIQKYVSTSALNNTATVDLKKSFAVLHQSGVKYICIDVMEDYFEK